MSMMDSHVETLDELLRGIEGPHKDDKARVEADLEEADETLSQMKMEIHSCGTKAEKDKYNAKIKEFQGRIAAARKGLLFSGSSGSSSSSSAASARIQSTEEKQAASLEVLKKARQQLAETEAIGTSTVENLAKQNEQIKKSKENVREINSNLSHSNKLLNKMSQWWRG